MCRSFSTKRRWCASASLHSDAPATWTDRVAPSKKRRAGERILLPRPRRHRSSSVGQNPAWDQPILEETLSALKIEPGLFQISLLSGHVRLSCSIARLGCIDPIFRGMYSRRLRLHIGASLHVILEEQPVALLDVVAFLYQDFGDSAESLGRQVRERGGPNLA